MTTLPILTYSEAEMVGAEVHDRWLRVHGEAPIARDNLKWADLVQFVTIRACELVVERDAGSDGMCEA